MTSSSPRNFTVKDLLNQRLFIEQLLCAEVVLGSEMNTVKAVSPNPCPHGAYILVRRQQILTTQISILSQKDLTERMTYLPWRLQGSPQAWYTVGS